MKAYLLAIVAGLVLPIQIAFNNRLTLYSGTPVISALCSFAVGTLALTCYSLTNPTALQKASQQIWNAPLYAWLGGFVGCFYIVTSLIVSPRLGLALTLSLVIAGQLSMSIMIDHFGWLGFDSKPFTLEKGVGLLLIFMGIALIKFK